MIDPRRGLVVAAIACGAAVVSAAQDARSVEDGVFSAAQAARGATVYAQQCAFCHGDDLLGAGFAPPLIADTFLQRWKGGSVGDLFSIVKRTMPADGPSRLSASEYAEVVAYLLSTNKWPAGSADLPGDPEALKAIRFPKP